MPINVAQFLPQQSPAASNQGVAGVGADRPRQNPALGGGANISQPAPNDNTAASPPPAQGIAAGSTAERESRATQQRGSGHVNVAQYLEQNKVAAERVNQRALDPAATGATTAQQAVSGMQVDTPSSYSTDNTLFSLAMNGHASPKHVEALAQSVAAGPRQGALDADAIATAQENLTRANERIGQLSDRERIGEAIAPQARGFSAGLNANLFTADGTAQTGLNDATRTTRETAERKAELQAEQAAANAKARSDYEALVERVTGKAGSLGDQAAQRLETARNLNQAQRDFRAVIESHPHNRAPQQMPEYMAQFGITPERYEEMRRTYRDPAMLQKALLGDPLDLGAVADKQIVTQDELAKMQALAQIQGQAFDPSRYHVTDNATLLSGQLDTQINFGDFRPTEARPSGFQQRPYTKSEGKRDWGALGQYEANTIADAINSGHPVSDEARRAFELGRKYRDEGLTMLEMMEYEELGPRVKREIRGLPAFHQGVGIHYSTDPRIRV